MTKEDWPKGISPIRFDDLDRLGLDEHHRLYWDGKQIEIKQSIHLSLLQKIAAWSLSFIIALGSIGAFLSGVHDAVLLLCSQGGQWSMLSCNGVGR